MFIDLNIQENHESFVDGFNLQISEFDKKYWNIQVDQFCQVFMHYFRSPVPEISIVATQGLGNIMIDFPRVRYMFFENNMLDIFISRLRDKNAHKIKKLVWFLYALCTPPYEAQNVHLLFHEIDLLFEKYQDDNEIVLLLNKSIWELTREQTYQVEMIKVCLNMKNFPKIIETYNKFEDQNYLTVLEILYNISLPVDEYIAAFLMKQQIPNIIINCFKKIDFKYKNEAAFIFYNLSLQGTQVTDYLVINSDNFISNIQVYALTENEDIRQTLFHALSFLLQNASQRALEEFLSMGTVKTITEAFDFQDVALMFSVLKAIFRCLQFGQSFIEFNVRNENPVLSDLKDVNFQEILESLVSHQCKEISSGALQILDLIEQIQQ